MSAKAEAALLEILGMVQGSEENPNTWEPTALRRAIAGKALAALSKDDTDSPTYQYGILYANGTQDGLGGDPDVLVELLRSGDTLRRRELGPWEVVEHLEGKSAITNTSATPLRIR